MPSRVFLTLSADLQVHASRVADDLVRRGYTLRIEERDLAYPFTPTVVARRGQTRRIVIVDTEARMDRLEAWSRYGRSSPRDTQIAVAVPQTGVPSMQVEDRLRALRVGLLVVGPESIVERIAPVDLAINIQAPKVGTLPRKTNRRLAPALEKVERGEWRDGFKDACETLEVAAREHLRDGMLRGRILLRQKSGKAFKLAPGDVDGLTMGQLARAYTAIQNPNKADDVVQRVMERLRKDRNAVTHHSRKGSTERRLRRNAGQHLWSISNAIRELMGE